MIQPDAINSAPISGWQALARVVTSPAETFGRLGDKPPLLPAYLLQMVVGVAVVLLMMEPVIDLAMQNAPATPAPVDP